MTANGSLFLARCPLRVLAMCSWESDPAMSAEAAHEAMRAHILAHRHADLVQFAAAHSENDVITYDRRETP